MSNLQNNRYSNLTIYLTLNCNLDCTYCFCGKKYNTDMTTDMLEEILYFYNNCCVEKNPTITFFGGEPLLKLDLIKKTIDLNKRIYDGKFAFSITTNGTLLNRETYDYLIANKVNVLLSLDGIEKSHNENRKFFSGEGSWQSIMNNIDDFISELSIRLTFSKHTISELSENVLGLYELGFNSIAFYPASGEDWNTDDFNLLYREVNIITEYIYQAYEEGKVLNSHWIDKSIWGHISGGMGKCNPGVNQMSITPDGQIYPCNHTNFSDKVLKLGNIFDGFDNKKIYWISEQLDREDEECNGCKFRSRCRYCYINMYEENSTLFYIPEWYCEMNKIVIKASDRLASKLYKNKNKLFMNKFY